MNKLLDYIFLTRPMLIIPVWTIALLGARASLWRERGLNPVTIDRFPFVDFSTAESNLLLMLLLATFLAGAVFVLNQIYDADSDRINKKLFLIADGKISTSEAWTLYIVLNVLAIGGAFIFNWQLGCLFIAGAWFGFQYSYPRLKLREHPYKQFRNNVVAHGTLAFLFGWVMYLNFNVEGILRSIPYFLSVGAVYLNTTLPDLEGDKTVGKITYGVEWGVGKTQKRALWNVIIAIVAAFAISDYACMIAALIALPFFIAALSRQSVAMSTLASKVAILALSLLAAFFFPPYLLILVLTISATRIYHAKRFGIEYPVFTEKSS